MEIANSHNVDPHLYFFKKFEDGLQLWEARESDLDQVQRLLQSATWRHQHVDWFPVSHWLGSRQFVVSRSADGVMGCLAIGADPKPAAWLRFVALERQGYSSKKLFLQLAEMVNVVCDHLAANGVKTVGWMAPIAWPHQWPEKLGFVATEQIVTYQKSTFNVPEIPLLPELIIRPATLDDMPTLAEIEAKAYEPIWRHSAEGLAAASAQAFSFDVAILNGQIVGFQHSASNRASSAHLARITVDPKCQGLGIGSHLLTNMIRWYQKRGVINMTLNTEASNVAAQKLYGRFGYKPNGHKFPLYTLNLR